MLSEEADGGGANKLPVYHLYGRFSGGALDVSCKALVMMEFHRKAAEYCRTIGYRIWLVF